MPTWRLRPVLLLPGLLFLLAATCLGQTAGNNVLTNEEVAKMVKAGLPEAIILREIQISRTNFNGSPAALIELKKRGASENVLGAVLDSWSNGGMPMPEALPGGPGPRSSGGNGFHANVRINKKAHESISVGHNHVEVQGSGIPAISVEWQANPPGH